MNAAEFSEQILDSPADVFTWETTGISAVFAQELDSFLPETFIVTHDEARAAVIVARAAADRVLLQNRVKDKS